MAFKRVQQQTHQIFDNKIEVSYDRFTTRFRITSAGKEIYSKLLLFRPIHKAKLTLLTHQQGQKNQQYELRIFWFVIWSAKLSLIEGSSKTLDLRNKLVIAELLEIRRRKSIAILIYSSCMGLLRLIANLGS
ncbi:hypothetical protein [Shewanella sp.]|uniref:hypothetical protein n=1 Tax=Shewanella sp. TaxID=50422 RepID=UPI001EB615F2|nr:hypothetical protein [Shewanella sp.]NRB23126.1 hypothetical protein [Shewanella sp.]